MVKEQATETTNGIAWVQDQLYQLKAQAGQLDQQLEQVQSIVTQLVESLHGAERSIREASQGATLAFRLQEELNQTVARLGLQDRVRFLDSQADAASVFAALDIVVVSSRYEGCCNVILEGMAMGKPVVATAVGGNSELVVPGQTGYLVPSEDGTNLATAINRLLEDPDAARAMGQAGRQRIEASFTIARMVDQTEQVYQRWLP